VERVVQKAEAALAQARKERHSTRGQQDRLAGSGRKTNEEQKWYDDDAEEEEDAEVLDTGMPEAFRAGMQAKLSGTFAFIRLDLYASQLNRICCLWRVSAKLRWRQASGTDTGAGGEHGSTGSSRVRGVA
jgi:hypothetical protein